MPTRRRVLIVDDEELVIASFSLVLEAECDVTALTSPTEAFRRLEAGESWDCILCDLQMPELDGVAFLETLQRLRPELVQRLAFMTGGAFTSRVRSFLRRNTRPLVEKPLEPSALRALVRGLAS